MFLELIMVLTLEWPEILQPATAAVPYCGGTGKLCCDESTRCCETGENVAPSGMLHDSMMTMALMQISRLPWNYCDFITHSATFHRLVGTYIVTTFQVGLPPSSSTCCI
jgi:hypothetical protein